MTSTAYSLLLHHAREAERLSATGNYHETAALLSVWSDQEILEAPELACRLADAWCRMGDISRALELLRGVEERIGWQENTRANRFWLISLGAAHFQLGQVETAESAWRALLRDSERAGDEQHIALAYNNLGVIADLQLRFDEAIALYKRAAVFSQRVGRWIGLSWAHTNLANTYLQLDRLDEADQQVEAALRYHDRMGNETYRWIAETIRAGVRIQRGDLALAETILDRITPQLERIEAKGEHAGALKRKAQIRRLQGRYPDALTLLQEAARLARQANARLREADVHAERARTHAQQGEVAEARSASHEACILFRMIGASMRGELLTAELASLGVNPAAQP